MRSPRTVARFTRSSAAASHSSNNPGNALPSAGSSARVMIAFALGGCIDPVQHVGELGWDRMRIKA